MANEIPLTSSGLNFKHNFVQIIDGIAAPTKETRHGLNPANLQPNAEVPVAPSQDFDQAVDSAKQAFKTWSKVPYEERKGAVMAFANAASQLSTDFRDLLVQENGKPMAQAEIETSAAIAWMRAMANIPLPDEIVEDTEILRIITRYTPVGVVAAIVPWNFPLLLAATKIAPAVLTGNVVIVKPSHPYIDKISFTGSTATGKAVLQSASKTLKRVTFELGGNDAAIVFPDVNIEKVAEKVALFSFINSGQSCLNVKRIYVHESIFDEFKAALVKVIQGYTIGDSSQHGISHGPVQNSMQYERVKTFFSDIKSQGWEVAVGGDIGPSTGYFITPTVIDRPPEDSRIVIEEPFAVASARRSRFTPFARASRTPVIANEDTMLPSFDNFPAYLFEDENPIIEYDQSAVLASLSELSATSNIFFDFTTGQNYGSSQTSSSPSSTATQSRASVAQIFINNKAVMSKSKDWTSILDPVSSLCSEVGKTIEDAESEVNRGLDCIHAACSIGPEMAGMFLGNDPTMLQTFYEPVGVCTTITPFSFPFMTPLWSIPYALITGNTVVLKPSERTVAVPSLIADAVTKAEFPPGVFNIVHGGHSVSQMLILQPLVRAISFVGSESAAKQVHDLARKAGKRVQAECGGKNHGVILEDAEMMPTLFAIAGSAFGAAGQRCMSLSVAIFVGNTARWIPKLVDIAKTMTVGNGSDPETKIGPLIDKEAKSKISGIIERSTEEGAILLCDGRDVTVPRYPNGNFLGPTILSGIETYMECYQTEIFGPVLICMQVDTLEEAIDIINQNKYGNGCSIFTTSGKHAKTFQRQVNVGQIGINIPLIAPYGTAVRTSNKASFMGG
ncbi:hypothetical protein N7478_013355 [Penicillium angulare]|uniref:uncharacterized protein n=1 Tax=Penicillium angulare TaxID=116970 RepID=UPI0025423BCA|nr:uncharacterized protein N7478_013355 [Penicillium angulare]KAJ5257251.1 hypothetical protein N7478_013355 [Penicillium angulare]